MIGFTPSQLQLPYDEWTKLIARMRPELGPKALRWLGSWNMWDLACSPMPDEQRRYIREGHYLGWMERDAEESSAHGKGE